MTHQIERRALAALVMTQAVVGCSRFVWKEDPFTPDQAPVTEIVVSGHDTTYVLRGSSYYLLAQERSALWNREVVDDVAWRYRALFGEAPPEIAIKLDSVVTLGLTDTTWRGLPLSTIGMKRRPIVTGDKNADEGERQESEDPLRARLLMTPTLSATAAGAWLEARALAPSRDLDSQPGGPERPVGVAAVLPAWLEAGALRITASGGAPDRAGAELRANQKGIVPLSALFAVAWQRKPNALEIAWAGLRRRGDHDDLPLADGQPRTPPRRESIPGVSSLFIAQSVSVLAFIHERDAALIARLAQDLPRGASVENVLGSSATLPHDLPAFEGAWRKWLQQTGKRR